MLVSLFQLFYLLMICGTGMSIMRFIKVDSVDRLFGSFIIGSLLFVGYLFAIIETMHLYLTWVYPLLAFGLLMTLINASYLYKGIVDVGRFINNVLFQHDKWRIYFIIAFSVLMIWIWMMSLTPPRAADAMLYHLAFPKQIIRDHGYRFYPYITYHFPLNFAYLCMPGIMLFSGVAYKVMVFNLFTVALLALIRVSSLLQNRYSRSLILLIILIPLSFHEAHSALNDWPVICYALAGFIFVYQYIESNKGKYIIIAMLALGFMLGIKYLAVLYLPCIAVILVYDLIQKKNFQQLPLLVFAALIMIIVACPFYVKNYIYFQNPFWPLLDKYFPNTQDYLQQLRHTFIMSNSGSHTIQNLLEDIGHFIKYPLIPISVLIAFVLSLPCIFNKKIFSLGVGVIFSLVFWFVIQPVMYLRFIVFLMPLILLCVFQAYSSLDVVHYIRKYMFKGLYLGTMLFGIAILMVYSPFYLNYLYNGNLDHYHQYTMYYKPIVWLNNHSKKNDNILVSLRSGQTYYLNGNYIRSDVLGGYINWFRITSLELYYQFLKEHKIKYIIYGVDLNKYEKEFLKSAHANLIYKKSIKIYTSRFQHKFFNQLVYIIKVV